MRDIILASLKTGMGAFLTLLFGTITTKVMATTLGPTGVGLFSLLRQTRDSIQMITTMNGQTALVQGLASRQDEDARRQYAAVVRLIMAALALLTVAVVLIFAPRLAPLAFGSSDREYIALLRWLTIPIVLGTGLMYLQGVLNGYRAIGRLAVTQVTTAAVSLALVYPAVLLVEKGYSVAFIGMMGTSALVAAMVAGGFVYRERLVSAFGIEQFSWDLFKTDAGKFISFAVTTLLVGLMSSWAILIVRSTIVSTNGLDSGGVFDAAWTLSMMYVTLVLTSFSTYYMPTLSQTFEATERVQLIRRILQLTMLLMVPIITGMVLLKPFVIELLYSSEFYPAVEIIRWMLIGDYFKVTSWTFGVSITASADKKTLFLSEFLWQAGFVVLSILSLRVFDTMQGIGMAFALLYLLHLIFTTTYVHVRHRNVLNVKIVLKWVAGLFILLGASIHTWHSLSINWGVTALWGAVALLYSAITLPAQERRKALAFINQKLAGRE